MADPHEDPTVPGMPEQPKTTKLQAADPALVLLTQIKAAMEAGFRETNANIDLVSGDLNTVKAEVRAIQTWKGEQEARASRHSLQAKAESSHDLEQDAQLAQERAAREALATKVDTLLAIGERLDKLAKHPVAKVVGTIIAVTLAGYAASHGIAIKP
jgi:hypothetical protein